MSISPDHHCSDETLLCFLDRELDAAEAAAAEQHLAACWLCRSRLGELDQSVQRIAESLLTSFRNTKRAAPARTRFLAEVARLENRRSTGERPARRSLTWPTTLAAALAACAVVAVVGYTLWPRKSTVPVVSTESVMISAERVERGRVASGRIAHQVFGWEIATRPASRPPRRGRVEIWTETSGKRYAARMFNGDGELIHAVWRPSQSQGKLLFPAAMVQGRFEWTGEPLERRIVHWLEARSPSALLLAEEFSAFCREFGMAMRVERANGIVRISGTKEWNGMHAEFALFLDASSSVPLRQTLTLSQDARAVEVNLVSQSARTLQYVSAAVFEPPARVAVRKQITDSDSSGVPAISTLPAHPPAPTAEEELVRLLYVLHLEGVCREESLDISQGESGRRTVRILVHSEERRNSIVRRLEQLPSGGHLDTEVYLLADSEWKRPSRNVSLDSPLQGAAARHALSVSGDLFAHAWALLQLAELPATDYSGEDRVLFARMVRDHLASLQSLGGDMRGTFSPLLDGAETDDAYNGVEDRAPGWRQSAFRLFSAAAQVHDACDGVVSEDHPQRAAVRRALNRLNNSLMILSRDLSAFDVVFARDLESKAITARKD